MELNVTKILPPTSKLICNQPELRSTRVEDSRLSYIYLWLENEYFRIVHEMDLQ